jgi:hypothetical protein
VRRGHRGGPHCDSHARPQWPPTPHLGQRCGQGNPGSRLSRLSCASEGSLSASPSAGPPGASSFQVVSVPAWRTTSSAAAASSRRWRPSCGGRRGNDAPRGSLPTRSAVGVLPRHGHAVVAQHFGILTDVEVWRREGTISAAAEKTWAGRCRLVPDPGEHRQTISLAGEVAAMLAGEEELGSDIICDALLSDPNALSETDRAGAGEFTYADVERTVELVQSLWPNIQDAAEREIADIDLRRAAGEG